MRWNALNKEACSIARTLSVVGDRWTLLVLREAFLRARRFETFQERLQIGRPILADRLRKLVKLGVFEKTAYQSRPLRYEYRLTQKGLDLYPLMMSLVHWGDEYLAGSAGPPLLHRHKPCGRLFAPVMHCSECGESVDPRQVEVLAGPGAKTRGRARKAA